MKTNIIPNLLFTSYTCSKDDEIICNILQSWQSINPNFTIKYFSDNDVDTFFESHYKNDVYKKLRNGVAKADFFRICYINKYGGYWFDIDINPVRLEENNKSNIALFDLGYKNISYMLIGGKNDQLLFKDTIEEVSNRINNNYSTSHGYNIMSITGPRIIQDIICNRLNIINKDGCLPGSNESKIYLKDTEYEFKYKFIKIKNHKIDLYKILQQKYKKLPYGAYNYI